MTSTKSTPVLHIRVIGQHDQADELLARLTEHARALFGPHATYRTHTRSARRIGQVRAYLTITAPAPSLDAIDVPAPVPRRFTP
jgi:hypothetical protein